MISRYMQPIAKMSHFCGSLRLVAAAKPKSEKSIIGFEPVEEPELDVEMESREEALEKTEPWRDDDALREKAGDVGDRLDGLSHCSGEA